MPGLLAVAILAGMPGCEQPAAGHASGEVQDPVAGEDRLTSSEDLAGRMGTDTQQATAGEPDQMESQESQEETYNLTFHFADSEKAIALLPQEIAGQIASLNAGEALETALGLEELEGYSALIGTHAIAAIDKDSGQEGTGKGKLTMYVPNLLASLQDVSVLFYDYGDGSWKIFPVEKMDADAKTVTVILAGSGIITVIYRRP